jgi:hypothetical protein
MKELIYEEEKKSHKKVRQIYKLEEKDEQKANSKP